MYPNNDNTNASCPLFFFLNVIIQYDPHLQLRYAGRCAKVAVCWEFQLLQQDTPSPSMVVFGEGVPAPGRMGVPSVVQNELLHGIPDRGLCPAIEGQLVDHGM